MNSSKLGTNSVTSKWVAPLGQTPDYLDPRSQEALYEVDVSGMELLFSIGWTRAGNQWEHTLKPLVRRERTKRRS
jgi:hypothetical protein